MGKPFNQQLLWKKQLKNLLNEDRMRRDSQNEITIWAFQSMNASF
jgi:hypothetical protein